MTKVVGIKTHLHNLFKTKDLGELRYFLGIDIARYQQGIHLCQKKFAMDLLNEFGFMNCKPLNNPMAQDCRLIKEGAYLENYSVCTKLIGKLPYLTTTRPDIAFAIQQLS